MVEVQMDRNHGTFCDHYEITSRVFPVDSSQIKEVLEMSDLLVKAGDDTARMDTHQVVKYLLDRLGPTLTAFIAGSKSRTMPARWAAPPGDSAHAVPSPDKVRRLQAAHIVFLLIEDAESDQVARNWLISANPRLDGVIPAELIRNDDIPAVYRAADAFVTDTYYS